MSRIDQLPFSRFCDLTLLQIGTPFRIPIALAVALDAERELPASFEDFDVAPLSDRVYAELVATMILQTDTGLPAHGREHAGTVGLGVSVALRLLQRRLSAQLPAALVQALTVGAFGHDARHGGATLRVDAAAHRLPKDTAGMTMEEIAAQAVDAACAAAGMALPARAMAVYAVLVTLYGQRSDRLERPGLRPLTFPALFDLLLRAADVVPSADLIAYYRRDHAVVHVEAPLDPRPRTIAETRRNALEFLTYTEGLLDDLDDAVAAIERELGISSRLPFTAELGWRAALVRAWNFRRRCDRSPVHRGIVLAEVLGAGADLDDELPELPRYFVESEAAVLVTDMCGSVEARRGMTLQDRRRLVRRHFRLLERIAGRFGATVFEHTGDGLMLTVAPERALLCARALIDEAAAADRDAGGWPIRVGAAFGAIGWDGELMTGLPVDLASRLCSRAGTHSGSLLVDERLAARPPAELRVVASGVFRLKGFGDVTAFTAVAAPEASR